MENWDLGEIILIFVDLKVELLVLVFGVMFWVIFIFMGSGFLLLLGLFFKLLEIVVELVLIVVVILLFLDDILVDVEILVRGGVENVGGVFFDWKVVLVLRSIFVILICNNLRL